MNRKCCAAAFAAAVLLSNTPAAAQDPPITLTPATPRTWDVSADVGWFSSNKSEIAQDWNDWYDVPAGSGAVGRYWTPHLRTEFRMSAGGEGTTYEEVRIPVAGEPFPFFRLREHRFRAASAGIGIFHQLFENQWFHPFAGGGLDVVRESHRTLSPEQRFPTRDPRAPMVIPATPEEHRVTYAARPFVATGFKWYVHERGFIRSEVKVSFGSDRISHTSWSAGIGVDL